jgi:hypothetical protein
LEVGGEGKTTREYSSKALLKAVTSTGSRVGDGMRGDEERSDIRMDTKANRFENGPFLFSKFRV